ncbi:hypothetical protein SSS_10639 [Sarcoptes scabiei]|nr:hypothetical protein SSS_10639 [Sarcoptes scabiei]
MDFNNNKITYPKSLYEISLGAFCEFLNRCSKSSTNKISTESNYHRVSKIIQLIYFFKSSLSNTTMDAIIETIFTDNLACNNFDDKLNTFKKSCHNLIGTFFGRNLMNHWKKRMKSNRMNYEPSYDYFRITENICGDIYYNINKTKINDRTLSLPFFDGE